MIDSKMSDFERMFSQQIFELQKSHSEIIASVSISATTQQHILECIREIKEDNKNNYTSLKNDHELLKTRVNLIEKRNIGIIGWIKLQSIAIIFLIASNYSDAGKFISNFSAYILGI